ncbi:hypothetical protein FQ142_08330 [Microbacterium sp. ANT_H45B]|uniref:hypothetical protein n=1 Tax=Microbacterium sp. ANT_H45B TaxID=2597346 RepID=UPI0011EDA114|nr:hypothetical protein [Microbacterium sp. ANT_H45B]KAA0960878.1 hypothetical protein FQ142_08330 [Microbacterium sp. ANT_H45B]
MQPITRNWIRWTGFAIASAGVYAIFRGSVDSLLSTSTPDTTDIVKAFTGAGLGAISVLYRAGIDIADAGARRLVVSVASIVAATVLAIILGAVLSSGLTVNGWPTVWMWIGFFATLLPPLLEDTIDAIANRRKEQPPALGASRAVSASD